MSGGCHPLEGAHASGDGAMALFREEEITCFLSPFSRLVIALIRAGQSLSWVFSKMQKTTLSTVRPQARTILPCDSAKKKFLFEWRVSSIEPAGISPPAPPGPKALLSGDCCLP